VSTADTPILFLAGTTPDTALTKTHRVIAPPLTGATPASLAAEIAGGAHVMAEGDAAPLACRLALDHTGLVKTLVLSAPTPADAALLARLGEITVPCLLLIGSNAPAPLQEAMAAYQQRRKAARVGGARALHAARTARGNRQRAGIEQIVGAGAGSRELG
jgi:hypothetical protein